MTSQAPKPVPEAVVQVLLAIAAVSVTGLVVSIWGWYRAATAPVTAADLSPEERQALVQQMVAISPGEHRWAYFEPRIGYTLRPDAELSIYDDTFRSNSLGYRTGPEPKAPGTFRIAFVGDSWTYGMGVRQEESYPRVLERLANRYAGAERPIEAWSLALPGYSAANYLSALSFFFERIRPDAVVVCPSSNDNHSMVRVLPDGSLWAGGVLGEDEFGDPHVVTYRLRRLDTYRFRDRWRKTVELMRDTEERLARLEIPLLYFFLARWQPVDVHPLMQMGGLKAPYVITPIELTVNEWQLPPPLGHGTPEAHERYARLVYRGLSQVLGWTPLPAEADPEEIEVFDTVPEIDPERNWDQVLAWGTRRDLAESFRPSPDLDVVTGRYHDAGRLDLATGLMGRSATVLVRRAPEARWVRIAVRRLSDAPSLYPLDLVVSVPSPSGGSRRTITLSGDDPEVLSFALEIPEDLLARAAVDVVFVAERVVASPTVLAARSLYIESVETSATPE